MKIQEIVNKIKLFLSEDVKMTDVKTVDGIILNFAEDALSVGIQIFVVDETGSNPAPDGEYMLEDGSKIEVKSGIVEEIMTPEAPVEAPVDELPVEEVPVEEVPVEAVKSSTEDLEAKIAKLEEANKQIFQILADMADNLSNKQLETEIKTEMSKSKIEKVELKSNNQRPSVLDNIFINMYKK